MNFGFGLCHCASNLSLQSLTDQSSTSQKPSERHLSSGNYITTNTTVCASKVRPLASGLHPKVRMSVKDYAQYKALMENLGCLPKKKVSFIERDYLSPEKKLPVGDYDIPRRTAISADYDIPRRTAISADYDIPRRTAISADYDIPRRTAISADYDIPRRTAISADYDIARRAAISAGYDIP